MQGGTPYYADCYDAHIQATIPHYREFHETAIDVVRVAKRMPRAWLDTGCGTGNLAVLAARIFPGTDFTLADPSETMLGQAKQATANLDRTAYIQSDSGSISSADGTFDVITAIQCHHYLERQERREAVENCYRMLEPDGIYISFENIRPATATGEGIALERWADYQRAKGKPEKEVRDHIARFDTKYFPITITQHIELLQTVGFSAVETIWLSYMQAGFYAVK